MGGIMSLLGYEDAPDPTKMAAQATDAAKQTAQTNFKMGSTGNNVSGIGAGTIQYGADGNPIGKQFNWDPSLGSAVSGVGTNLGLLGGQLPGTFIDYSGIAGTPQQIADAGVNAMYQTQLPLMQQAFAQQGVANDVKGLPVGSEARNLAEGNLARNWSAGLSQGAASIYNAMPANWASLTDTTGKQGMSKYGELGANLGLMSNFNTIANQDGATMGQYQQQFVNPAEYAYKSAQLNNEATTGMWGDVAKLGGAVVGWGMGMPSVGGGGSNGGSTGYDFGKTPFGQAWGGAKAYGQGLFNGMS